MPSTRSQTTKYVSRSYSDAVSSVSSPTSSVSVAGGSNPTTPSTSAFSVERCGSRDDIYVTPRLPVGKTPTAELGEKQPQEEELFFSAGRHEPFCSPGDGDRCAFITYIAKEIDAKTKPLPRDYTEPLQGIDAIPTLVYLDRISQLTGMESGAFIAALVLLSRVFEKHRGLALTPLNAKRLIVASTLVASKLFSDEPCANVLWARFSGTFGLDEINAMEGELLAVLGFDLVVTEEEYQGHVARARSMAQISA